MHVDKQRQKQEQEVKLIYEYECKDCHHSFTVSCKYADRNNQLCPKCNGKSERFIGCPAIIGTRDSFGIKNAFRDEESGKEIDNWKSWEKAGYRDPLETTNNHAMKEKIKDNIKKRKNK